MRCLALLLLLFAVSSSALAGGTYWGYTVNGGTVRGPSVADVCQSIKSTWYPTGGAISVATDWCTIAGTGDFWPWQGTCPGDQTLQSGQPGPNGTTTYACVDAVALCQAKANQTEDNILFPVIGGSASSGACLGGCSISRNGSAVVVDGAASTAASGKYTGQTCDAAGTSNPAQYPDPPQGCAEINGSTICVTASNPNCGTIDGKNVCLQTPPTGSCTFMPGGSYVCDSTAPSDVTHRPIDGDGHYIPPDFNLIPGPGTTVNRSVDGWGSGTMGNASNGTAANGNGDKVGDCVGASCGSGDDKPGASFSGGGQFQPGEGSGSFPNDETDAEIASARQQLSDLVGSIRSQVSGMFDGMLSEGAGQLPCTDHVEILGKNIDFCFTEFEGSLSVFRLALLFIVLVICLLLVLGAWR